MAKKRPTWSFPELEHRGRRALLRTREEVEQEHRLLEGATQAQDALVMTPPHEPLPDSNAGKSAHQQIGESANRHAEKPAKTPLTEKETFRCTLQEVWDINDLRGQVWRDLDIKFTKQALERAALQAAVEDYRQHGRASLLVQKLRDLDKAQDDSAG